MTPRPSARARCARRRSRSGLGLLLALLGLPQGAAFAGCGVPSPAETVQLRLSSPFAFDPLAVQRVAIAVVHQPKQTCLRAAGTQACGELSSVNVAAQAEGYVAQAELDRQAGPTATFTDLPEGRTCFVADAFDGADAVVASGCAEVDLRLGFQRIEIAITGTP